MTHGYGAAEGLVNGATEAAAEMEAAMVAHPVAVDDDYEAWRRMGLQDATRFKMTEAREAQEREWAATNVNARQIFGAREAQRLHGARLRQAVIDLHNARWYAEGPMQSSSAITWMIPLLAARIAAFAGGQGRLVAFLCRPRRASTRSGDGILVCVRKRPPLPVELEGDIGTWDAVEVDPRNAEVLCHDGRLTRSGRKLAMTHRRFILDRAWGGACSTEAVYADVLAPLVAEALGQVGGGRRCSTVLCTGQTGTGKTYTLRGFGRCLANDLHGLDLEVEFFEIHGRRCLDLLAERKEVHLRTDGEGRVRVRGNKCTRLPSGEGLEALLDDALRLRASEETERNAASSRSHAVCVLRFLGEVGEGSLRLVDLAGSERNYETTQMSARQHKESADINASLMVLKDCFRAHAARQRGDVAKMPFRESPLTQVLRDCFEDQTHRFVVIATVSPMATDVIHSINTLRHAAMLAKPLMELACDLEVDLPLHFGGAASFKQKAVIDWSPQEVLQWLGEAEDGRFAHLVVPPSLDGRQLLTTSPQGLAELFEGTLRQGRGANEGEAWNVQAAPGGRYHERPEGEEENGEIGPVEMAATAADYRIAAGFGRDLFAAARRAALASPAAVNEGVSFFQSLTA